MKRILILMLLPIMSGAQQSNNIDSLKKLMQAHSEDTIMVNTLILLNKHFIMAGDYTQAIDYAEQAKVIADKIGFKKGVAQAYNNIGIINYEQGNYPEALKNYFTSLKIRESIKDKKLISMSYNNIGNVYNEQKNYEAALKNHLLSLSIKKEIDDKHGASISYNNIANVYEEQGNYEEALRNNLMALSIQEEVVDKSSMALTYNNLGNLYYDQKKYDEALGNHLSSLRIRKEIGDKGGVSSCYINIAYVYIGQNKISESIDYLNKGLRLAKEIGNKNYIRGSYMGLSKADSIKHDFKAAYENYKLYVMYNDSLVNEDNTKRSVQEQMNYEFGKKELALKAEQDKKDAIAQTQRQKQRVIIYSVSAGLFLVLMLAIFIFRGYKQKQKANISLEEKNGIIVEKNKEITDSIRYASRIQQAILPPDGTIKDIMPEHFIYFEPKDIVSGDFYFVDKNKDKVFWASADATGHGSSGALLSMLGINILSGIIKDGEVVPSRILDKLNEKLNESLHKVNDDSIRDGMDVALCSYDKDTMTLNYAGANNPLWVLREGEIIEYKADKMPIGQMYKNALYANHEIQLRSGDCVYSFSDGICDQFNGNGKKFMKKRLRELLLSIQDKPIIEQKSIVSKAVSDWKSDCEQTDDMLLIAVKV